jgi:hypothetical protein
MATSRDRSQSRRRRLTRGELACLDGAFLEVAFLSTRRLHEEPAQRSEWCHSGRQLETPGLGGARCASSPVGYALEGAPPSSALNAHFERMQHLASGSNPGADRSWSRRALGPGVPHEPSRSDINHDEKGLRMN